MLNRYRDGKERKRNRFLQGYPDDMEEKEEQEQSKSISIMDESENFDNLPLLQTSLGLESDENELEDKAGYRLRWLHHAIDLHFLFLAAAYCGLLITSCAIYWQKQCHCSSFSMETSQLEDELFPCEYLPRFEAPPTESALGSSLHEQRRQVRATAFRGQHP